jgi:hypothetical protein
VLIVREWTIRGKPYKATWATGKFLTDMRLMKVEEEVLRRRSGGEASLSRGNSLRIESGRRARRDLSVVGHEYEKPPNGHAIERPGTPDGSSTV